MFKKNKKLLSSSPSIIANDVEIKGQIECSKIIFVYGKITGGINSISAVKIEFGGEVFGNIRAREVMIKGRVIGDIECHSLLIAKGGYLKGTTKSKVFILEPQADFEGASHMAHTMNNEKMISK